MYRYQAIDRPKGAKSNLLSLSPTRLPSAMPRALNAATSSVETRLPAAGQSTTAMPRLLQVQVCMSEGRTLMINAPPQATEDCLKQLMFVRGAIFVTEQRMVCVGKTAAEHNLAERDIHCSWSRGPPGDATDGSWLGKQCDLEHGQ